MTSLTPIRRALLATDGSEYARAATGFAGALAWPPGTSISLASIIEAPDPSTMAISHLEGKGFSDWRRVLELSYEAAGDRARENVAAAAATLRACCPSAVLEEVVGRGEPAAELLALLRSTGAELAIAGACGRSALGELLLGSVSEALVTEAPCPVLVVRRPVTDVATVVVGVSTAADAELLADVCVRLPLPAATRLVAVAASAPQPATPAGRQPFAPGQIEAVLDAWSEGEHAQLADAGHRFVGRIQGEAPGRPVEARIARGELIPSMLEARADIAPTLLAEAEALNADLIVVGAREHRGLPVRLGLGSVSRKIVRRAQMAVLVVRSAQVG
jgi:nucleotide-binding universal stress UspA family protein